MSAIPAAPIRCRSPTPSSTLGGELPPLSAEQKRASRWLALFCSASPSKQLARAKPALEASLHHAACNALDESIEEEVVEDRHRKADQQRRRHDRAPEVDVAADELGRHPHGHRLLIAG